MDRVYLFLIRNDVWIYIVSVLGLVWYITEFIRSARTLRRAMFNLERETATASRTHALSFILFFSAVIGIVFFVNRNIAPGLPDELMMAATPTPNIFATPLTPPTPLGTPLAEGESAVPPVLAPTVTFPAQTGSGESAEAAGTSSAEPQATPDAPPTPFQDCIPELTISEPLNGSVAFQRIVLRGTANTGELHQYIIELNGPQTVGAWAPISQEPQSQPIVNGDLGEADLSQWETGPYLVRMRALDASGLELGFCVIQITLDN